ncbi:O-antigen ligase family protein [Natronorubrum tibetense]|uniref:O-antigen ligase-related domain-containing protein n=1 Tax=Natronorubrum tibetense GA33 TaxID=1114856 RepID=L9VR53_9EURY|nr:O-antigen ligase family protein [Natronorubrum tibetense]ELY39639.1 hypothetical protein C496_13216 [Natronorubrum tibetense GA33]
MSDWRDTEYLWGRSPADSPTVPLHYPLLAVFAIVVSIAPSTWYFSTDQGYLLSAVVLAAITVYGVVFTGVRLSTDPAFLVLFGGYWLGLMVQYRFHAPQTELFYVALSAPLAVFATVVVLPRFVEGRRQTFAMALTLAAVAVALVGILVLWWAGTADTDLPDFIGEEVMGLYAIRTVSVFSNPNPYGFFMMIGCLAALYTVLVRGGLVWIVALGICVLGLIMSEGDAALAGVSVGTIIVLAGRHRLLSFLGIGVGVAVLYAGIRIGHVSEVMQTTLMSRINLWVRSVELLAADPLWGIGFADVGSQIGIGREFDHSSIYPPLSSDTGTSSGPHNSYLYPLLSTGVIAGSLYLGSLVYALGRGIRGRWTAWKGFVVGTAAGIYVYMAFESHFLGGLGVSSVVFGLFVGLMLLTEPEESERESRPATAREALATSRLASALTRVQQRAAERDGTGSRRESRRNG